MSFIALVGPEVEENLGLRSLSAVLRRASFRTAIVPFSAGADLVRVRELILGAPEPPLLVALSLSFQWRALDVLALAVALREAGYAGHLTAGGHFGTFCREDLLRDCPELDSICCFEAEDTLLDLVTALAQDRPWAGLPGLATRDGGDLVVRPSPDLARLPWPDRRGPVASCLGHAIAPIVASRGCYARCAFCCIAAWHDAGGAGVRFRLRSVEDVADEMAHLQRTHGSEIFIFHDDDFFVPGGSAAIARFTALSDALAARGVTRLATVVKARPNDVTPEAIGVLRDRLGLTRVFLGVESAAAQGLRTLGRGVSPERNQAAMDTLAAAGVYVCFNLLVFDPDATPESLEANLAFMETHAETPFNFGRVELYAGTPLLQRMQAEGRCRGDYLAWDYRLADPVVDRVHRLSLQCFFPRCFSAGALANRLMGTRYDVEVSRHFHPDRQDPAWTDRARALSRRLALDTVSGLRALLAHARGQSAERSDAMLVATLSARLRATEAEVETAAAALEHEIQATVGARCRHARQWPATLEIG